MLQQYRSVLVWWDYEQSEHIATGLKFIEAEVISLSNSQFYIVLHHIMWLGPNETQLCPKSVVLKKQKSKQKDPSEKHKACNIIHAALRMCTIYE